MAHFDAKSRKRDAVATLAELAREIGVPEARRPKKQDVSRADFNELCDYLQSKCVTDA